MKTKEDIQRYLEWNHEELTLLDEYSGNKKNPNEWKCEVCGVAFIKSFEFLDKKLKANETLCPDCSPSKTFRERWVRFIFEELFNHKFPKVRPDFMRPEPNHRPLELDGYCEKLKLAFEFQGRHHDGITRFTPTEESLERQRDRDRKKKPLCKNKGITLFTIEYCTEAKDLESKVREAVKGFTLIRDKVNWSNYSSNHKETAPEKARLHAVKMGYTLSPDHGESVTDYDYVFECSDHPSETMRVRKIKVGKSPFCGDCRKKEEELKRREIEEKEMESLGAKLDPKMEYQFWAGRDGNKRYLLKCKKCKQFSALDYKTVKDKVKKQECACISCNDKVPIKYWRIEKRATELGGKCVDYKEINNKKDSIKLDCHNSDHPHFELTVQQLLDSKMWCPEPPCNERKGKKSKIQGSEISALINERASGFSSKGEPSDGSNTVFELICNKCSFNAGTFTYKKLKNRKNPLKCEFCS